MRDLDTLFAHLGRSPFRQRFRLNSADAAYLARHELSTIRAHAERFVGERLAAAQPANDGQQTPMRNHPVFVAQHATASCCRGCLAKWHGIASGRALNDAEQAHIVAAIMCWLADQPLPPPGAANPKAHGQPDLFE